jgi:nucleoside-diphosphate-sugar epimerase
MQWLITGGDHTVGRAVAREALRQGHQAKVLVSDLAHPESVALAAATGCELVVFAWTDPEEKLLSAMAGCAIVAHTDTANPWSLSRAECEKDVLIRTEIVLSCAQAAKVKRVLFRSTDRVTSAGEERRNADESLAHSPQWISPWDEMMSVAEGLVLSMTSQTEGVALRPAFVWGDNDDESLPRLRALSASGELILPGGGNVSFCTTHIENLALAFVAAATAENIAGKSFWITDEEHITARKFLTRLLLAHGHRAPRTGMLPYRAVALLRALYQRPEQLTRAELAMYGVATSLDTRAARKELSYEPRLRIDEGIARLVAAQSKAK